MNPKVAFFSTLSLLLVGVASPHATAKEPFLEDLEPGVFLKSSELLDEQTNERISRNLGGKIVRLSNSHLIIHGRAIQVNGITASDEQNAKAIHAAVLKIKPFPYCFRRGNMVVEYVGKNLDEAIAYKTSFELGFAPKPTSVRYRITAELATVDKADYMACNPLFNQFLRLDQGGGPQTVNEIKRLSERFTFGKQLKLRNPKIDAASYALEPKAASSAPIGSSATAYMFARVEQRHGVPFVKATFQVPTKQSGFSATTDKPSARLTAATPHWPADDAKVRRLAARITKGKATNQDKAAAILKWLGPGRNIHYSRQTGSRWGTLKVLEQRFGHCWDYSDCFVTLCRAADVPSRQVAGWLYGSSGHVWAEYYQEGKGWQQVDATGSGRVPCGIYHIPYFTTEDGEMPIVYLSMPKITMLRN